VRADDNVTSSSDHVDVDLRHGIVKGYSQYVTFVVSPSPTVDDRCSAQSIVGVDLTRGPFNRVRLTLDYSGPRLWTVDVSDSIHADGYGVSHVGVSDAPVSNTTTMVNTMGNMAEVQVRLLSTCPNVLGCISIASQQSLLIVGNVDPLTLTVAIWVRYKASCTKPG